MSKKKKKKETKRKSSVLEYEVYKIMEACMKQAMEKALDEIFKG